MGNTCCNERGDGEMQALKTTKPAFIAEPPKEDTKKMVHLTNSELSPDFQQTAGQYPFQIATEAEIQAFTAHPLDYLSINKEKIRQAIAKHGFFKLAHSTDSRIPYYKAELKSLDGRIHRYFGQMDGAKKEGRGQLHFLEPQGQLVVCNFSKDVAEGEGAVYFANGDYFHGTLAKNHMVQGTLYLENGNKYHGTFVNDLYEGAGTFTFFDGRTYKGQFRSGKKDGRGVFTWANSDVYDGEWKAGKQEGHGVLTQGAKRFEGQFLDGKKVKQSIA